MNGLRLASLYSLPPCSLGFCGQKKKGTASILKKFLTGKKIAQLTVRKTLKNFAASFPYYQLISQSNKIKDPFNVKVVEAYWIGNRLLDKVKFADLKKTILKDFTKPGLLSVKEAEKRISRLAKNVKPHHSFHVLILGPVAGRIKFYGPLYDLCRISWGKIVKIQNSKFSEKIVVKYRQLVVKNKIFLLKKEIKKEINWNKKFLPSLKTGDLVSFHWDNVCQKINKEQQKNLLKYTLLNIRKSTCFAD